MTAKMSVTMQSTTSELPGLQSLQCKGLTITTTQPVFKRHNNNADYITSLLVYTPIPEKSPSSFILSGTETVTVFQSHVPQLAAASSGPLPLSYLIVVSIIFTVLFTEI